MLIAGIDNNIALFKVGMQAIDNAVPNSAVRQRENENFWLVKNLTCFFVILVLVDLVYETILSSGREDVVNTLLIRSSSKTVTFFSAKSRAIPPPMLPQPIIASYSSEPIVSILPVYRSQRAGSHLLNFHYCSFRGRTHLSHLFSESFDISFLDMTMFYQDSCCCDIT